MMGKVIMSGIVPPLVKPKRALPSNFADATWEEIIEACQTNTVPGTWEVGDQKPMTIGGIDYPIDIIGKDHDTYSDGSGIAPLTFQMHDCYGTKYAMNSTNTNAGGWGESEMRTTHLLSIIAVMPAEVQTALKEVSKKAGIRSEGIFTYSDKLFLLSEKEVFGSTPYASAVEGTQYDYYKAGNSVVKTLGGAETAWFLRSSYYGDEQRFCRIGSAGSDTIYYAGTDSGVSFAFCF